jgi:hypothetical protein
MVPTKLLFNKMISSNWTFVKLFRRNLANEKSILLNLTLKKFDPLSNVHEKSDSNQLISKKFVSRAKTLEKVTSLNFTCSKLTKSIWATENRVARKFVWINFVCLILASLKLPIGIWKVRTNNFNVYKIKTD